MDEMLALLKEILEQRNLIRLVFGNKRKKSAACQKVTVRPFSSGEGILYQAEYAYEKKALHENLTERELFRLFQNLMENDFKQANLFTADADYQILASKPEKPKILKRKATKQPPSLEHNHQKRYLIPDGIPCDFLIRLGVMNDGGTVLKKHYAKFRQINRFLEIAQDAVHRLPRDKALKIIDFGCGKAYLTFALYHFFNRIENWQVNILGLDLKEDVVAFCNEIARDLHYDALRFEVGDIAQYKDTAADMVVTLHACDTATDYALLNAHKWQASVILSVPCCQHELFDQMKNDLHSAMLNQGILRERFCAILTDTLRVLKLKSWGYDVSMIEFTSLEHTAKNIMIRAVNTGHPDLNAKEEAKRLCAYWNVNPTILREDPS